MSQQCPYKIWSILLGTWQVGWYIWSQSVSIISWCTLLGRFRWMIDHSCNFVFLPYIWSIKVITQWPSCSSPYWILGELFIIHVVFCSWPSLSKDRFKDKQPSSHNYSGKMPLSKRNLNLIMKKLPFRVKFYPRRTFQWRLVTFISYVGMAVIGQLTGCQVTKRSYI